MRIFAESLKRLYELKQVNEETIDNLLALKKISYEEAHYILGKDGDK